MNVIKNEFWVSSVMYSFMIFGHVSQTMEGIFNLWRKIDTDTTGDLSRYGGCLSVVLGTFKIQ